MGLKILTTGVSSGIGKYIHENLGGIGLTRKCLKEEYEKVERTGVDVIIHCAFNSNKEIKAESLYNYVEDNVFLTKDLVSFPHKKFIYFSTVDVYPKNGITHSEEETIPADSIKGIYGISKLISESIIKESCRDYIILRPTALLGRYSRKNSLMKLMDDKDCILTLSGDSRLNYVLHTDILNFIKFALDEDLKGIYNISSGENVTLSEIADSLGKKVSFGTYCYDVGNISNNKISSIFPIFKKTSKEVVSQFIKERYG